MKKQDLALRPSNISILLLLFGIYFNLQNIKYTNINPS